MNTTFKTKQEAIENGWEFYFRKSGHIIKQNKNFALILRDTSGNNSCGYSYSIFLSKKELIEKDESCPIEFIVYRDIKELCKTTTISLTEELNKMKTRGCYSKAFLKSEFENALLEI